MFRPLTPTRLTVDIVVAAVFFAVTSWFHTPGSGTVEIALGLVVSAMMAAAVGLRRLSPVLALSVAWVGAGVQMAGGLSPMPSNLAVLAVLYTTAAYGTRAVFWVGFASSLVGAAVITVYLFASSLSFSFGVDDAVLSLAFVTYVAATFGLLLAWTAGALVRTALRARTTRRAQQRAEAEAMAEQERVAIARDMHDVVAHSLAVVIAQADGARYAASSDPSAAPAALATISSTARAALADVRLLLTQLRHREGDGPQPTIADLEELYAQVRGAGVALRVDVDPAPPGEPPAAVQLAVYRILQEALTNALRHGTGEPVLVGLAWHPDRVQLTVTNPVRPAGRRAEAGHGLIGMRERASLVGGTLTAAESDGRFTVTATLPVGGPV
ncbi:histidine kinase [Microbacterium sp. 1P10UB]|uniref:sensor histidine kinase n=1 Tax=unclassified Microbacterium TaxID=2609290 RepID=UPI0039A1D1EC